LRFPRFLIAVLLGSFVLLLAACSGQGQQGGKGGATESPSSRVPSPGAKSGVFAGEELVPPVPAPPFDLTDHKGRRTKLSDYKGRYVLLTFAYTACPDICPRLARSFKEVEKAFEKDVDRRISFVIISVDPEGDTTEKARRWTEAFGGSWRYLVGSRFELEKVWDAYGILVQKASDGSIGHAVKTYLIDPNGLVRLRYMGVGWERAAISDLNKIMGEK